MNNRSNRTICEICSKLTIKASERSFWWSFFIANFEQTNAGWENFTISHKLSITIIFHPINITCWIYLQKRRSFYRYQQMCNPLPMNIQRPSFAVWKNQCIHLHQYPFLLLLKSSLYGVQIPMKREYTLKTQWSYTACLASFISPAIDSSYTNLLKTI